jgi:hypothetical protein
MSWGLRKLTILKPRAIALVYALPLPSWPNVIGNWLNI